MERIRAISFFVALFLIGWGAGEYRQHVFASSIQQSSAVTLSQALTWGAPITSPLLTSFTSQNKQTNDNVITGTDYEALYKQRGNASGVNGTFHREVTLPATPWTVTGCFMWQPGNTAAAVIGGLTLFDGTKVQGFWQVNNSTPNLFDFVTFTDATQITGTGSGIGALGWRGNQVVVCERISDDGTNRRFFGSGDLMRTWTTDQQWGTTVISHTTGLTPTQAGYGCFTNNGGENCTITIVHFKIDNTAYTYPFPL